MKFFIYITFSLLLSLQAYATMQSQDWQRSIVNYERGEYKGGVQNWMIDQSKNNKMYFANSDGLLEFDGTNWELYLVKNNIVRSIHNINNRMYIGGSSEFGYFEANEKGKLIYHSLSENTSGWGGEVWNIINKKEYIYFVSEHYIHIFNSQTGTIKAIEPPEKIDCSALINDTLYLGTVGGIFYLSEENHCILLPESGFLLGYKLTNLCLYKNQLLVSTSNKGIFLFDNSGKLNRVESIADDFIKNNQIFSVAVSGTRIALGSVQNGIFIFDLESPLYKETFNLKNGLNNNTILDCYFDNDLNLWLGLDKGIAYINLKSPIRPLFATISAIGTGYCSIIYNNELYLGTNQALYKVSDGKYRPINRVEGQIWSLNIIDGKLFSSGDNGVAVISPTESYQIDIPGAWETHILSDSKDKLIVGTYSGFSILEKNNGRWAFSHKIPYFTASCRGFIEDEESYSFWVTNTSSNIQRITFDKDFSRIEEIKNYELENANIKSNSIFRVIDNNLVVCADNGVYQYSRISDSFYKNNQLEATLDGSKYYDYLYIDRFKNLWYIADHQLKLKPYVNGKYEKKLNYDLSNDLIGSFQNVFLADSSTAIISVDNAFFKIDLSQDTQSITQLEASIRTFSSSKNDSIIHYGNSSNTIELPYDLNSVKIDFVATNFTHTSEILYTYKLNVIDKEWSIPSSNTSKEYTNLPAGNYTFEVKAFINGTNVPYKSTTFSFRINPPWYKSPIACIIYIIIIFILLFLLYKETIRRQKKIISQKKEELITQSKKHKEETDLKDKEIYELQNENLRNKLQHKTHELNGYLLNIVRKNEMLVIIKKNAMSISKAIDEGKQTSYIRQKVMGLLGQINTSLEHDDNFDVFQSNFDSIHYDFFKILDERFPQLNRNDKVLCAYLKMNLSSKEIAPLLNISIRGVEVSRYRLRKKMNLNRNENLSEYMNSIK